MKNSMKKLIILFILLALSVNFTYAYMKTNQISLLTVAEYSNNSERGGIATLTLSIKPGSGRIFIDSFPLSKIDTQITTRFANEIACDFLNKDCSQYDFFYTIKASSAIVGGPSAGAATTVLTISSLDEAPLDEKTIMTGTINSGNLIGPVAGISAKTNAAQNNGFRKVLIPKWDVVNETPDENLTIIVVPVSSLEDALYEFTGKNYSKANVQIRSSEKYTEIMQEVTKELCTKYGSIENDGTLVLPNLSLIISDFNNKSTVVSITSVSNESDNLSLELNTEEKDYFSLALTAISSKKYYSAASFCFAGNYRITKELMKNYTQKQLSKEYVELYKEIITFENSIDNKSDSFTTLSELETYVVVKERLADAMKSLQESLVINDSTDNLTNNSMNDSIFNSTINPDNILLTKSNNKLSYAEIAYAKERFNTARIWSKFFDLPGQKFVMDKEALKVVCTRKLGEAEERINYVELYFPKKTNRDELDQAYSYYNGEQYALCIFSASKAKANANVILSALFIDPKSTDQLVDEKILAAEKVIAKQEENNIFPILGYSYYEYANSLKTSDTFSALLYAEYSLELSNLDMYFPKQNPFSLNINWTYVWFLLLGFSIGLLFTLIVGFIVGIQNKRKLNENKSGLNIKKRKANKKK